MSTNKILAMCGLAVAFALSAARAPAQEVRTDYDHKVTFEKYHTYSWGRVQASNPLWQSRIQDAIDRDLQGKGWQRVENSGDATVMAVGATQNEHEYQTFYNGLGGWRWGGFGQTATTTVSTYRIGTLVVDIFDAQTKQLLFRGVASDTLSDKPEKNEKKLDEAVNKMFRKFPPDRDDHERGHDRDRQ
jgi:hypothetical protein